MAGNVYQQYVWLLDLINRRDGITFRKISDAWQISPLNDTGQRLPRRTFINHLQKIKEIFDIDIECTSGFNYRITYSGDIDLDSIKQSLLAHLQLSNALFANPKLAKRISLDGYLSFRYFSPLIEAMENGFVVELNFLHHEKDCRSYPKICPYYIKQFEKAWFVVGRDIKKNAICAYAFNDIVAIRISEEGEKFDMSEEVDVTEFMRNPEFGETKYNNNDLYMQMHEKHKCSRHRNRWGTYTPEDFEAPRHCATVMPLTSEMMEDDALTKPVALYVHGLASGGDCRTFQELKKRFPQFYWVSNDYGEDLAKNVERIELSAGIWEARLVVGSSFGGLALLYADTPDVVKVVCNPALSVADSIRNTIGLGEHEYFCKRMDKVQEFELTETMCKEYEKYIATHPVILGKENYAMFSAHDELLGDKAAAEAQKIVAKAGYNVVIDPKGGHRLGDSAFEIIEKEIIAKHEFKTHNDLEQEHGN